jgi:catechol 2,3-dioxygenase-like lactoylglutathione lyase family enzyme
MNLEAIDHVQVAIPKGAENRAREFYEGLLGLPELAKPPELAKRGGCWFESETVKVHCGVNGCSTSRCWPSAPAPPAMR